MQINSNYSMNGVSYETRHKQNNIPQFSTECAVQKNENINPYMAEADFDEKAFDMIGPNTPRDVKDAWMEAAKDVNANGMGIKKNGMLSHISQMMVQRLNKQLKGDRHVGKYNRVCNSGNESGSLRFRSPTGICSEKYRSSASLYERKRVLCCFSGKIRKTKSKLVAVREDNV